MLAKFMLDLKDFGSKFNWCCLHLWPDLAGKALFHAAAHWVRDAIMEEPRAPHKTGTLWNSQCPGGSENQVDVGPTITTSSIECLAGFNVGYAARLHEAPSNWNWTLEGSGPKYLEAKAARHKDDYMKEAAEFIRTHAP
jgi:hypothetical protein